MAMTAWGHTPNGQEPSWNMEDINKWFVFTEWCKKWYKTDKIWIEFAQGLNSRMIIIHKGKGQSTSYTLRDIEMIVKKEMNESKR